MYRKPLNVFALGRSKYDKYFHILVAFCPERELDIYGAHGDISYCGKRVSWELNFPTLPDWTTMFVNEDSLLFGKIIGIEIEDHFGMARRKVCRKCISMARKELKEWHSHTTKYITHT